MSSKESRQPESIMCKIIKMFQDVKMYCATNQLPGLNVLGTHNKPHGVRGIGKHSYMYFDPKLVHCTYAIRSIPCDCTLCT